jgi:hypothetical protein
MPPKRQRNAGVQKSGEQSAHVERDEHSDTIAAPTSAKRRRSDVPPANASSKRAAHAALDAAAGLTENEGDVDNDVKPAHAVAAIIRASSKQPVAAVPRHDSGSGKQARSSAADAVSSTSGSSSSDSEGSSDKSELSENHDEDEDADANEDDDGDEEPIVFEKKQLPTRSTRGVRSSRLVGEAAEADEVFWGQSAFDDDETDDEYSSDSEGT